MRAQALKSTVTCPHPAVQANAILGDFDRFQLAGDCRRATVRTLKPHDPLFSEGDRNGYIYEVLSGIVCNYKLLPDGRRQVISFAYPGDLVGLGGGEFYAFSADSVSAATVRPISLAALDRQMRLMPELSSKLLQATTAELTRARNRLMTLGRRTAMERLASFLMEVAEHAGEEDEPALTFDLSMTRADIADFLGLTIETVSRNLTRLRVAGIIDLPQPTKVVVRDMDRLIEMMDSDGDDR